MRPCGVEFADLSDVEYSLELEPPRFHQSMIPQIWFSRTSPLARSAESEYMEFGNKRIQESIRSLILRERGNVNLVQRIILKASAVGLCVVLQANVLVHVRHHNAHLCCQRLVYLDLQTTFTFE